MEKIPFFSFLVFALLLAGRIFYLLKKKIQVRSKSTMMNRKTTTLYILFVLIFILWLCEIVKLAFHIPVSPVPEFLSKPLVEFSILKIAGSIVVILSMATLELTLLHFKESLRFGTSNTNQGKLVTDGIFSFSRNPFFVSVILWFAGIFFIYLTVFFLVFLVSSIISIHFFILKEEKFMKGYYGIEYAEYIKRVRRYF